MELATDPCLRGSGRRSPSKSAAHVGCWGAKLLVSRSRTSRTKDRSQQAKRRRRLGARHSALGAGIVNSGVGREIDASPKKRVFRKQFSRGVGYACPGSGHFSAPEFWAVTVQYGKGRGGSGKENPGKSLQNADDSCKRGARRSRVERVCATETQRGPAEGSKDRSSRVSIAPFREKLRRRRICEGGTDRLAAATRKRPSVSNLFSHWIADIGRWQSGPSPTPGLEVGKRSDRTRGLLIDAGPH